MTTEKTYSTDPDWYTAGDACAAVPTDVLQAVYLNAEKTYFECGGHKMAARMRLVMNNVLVVLHGRDIWTEVPLGTPHVVE